MVYDCVFFLLLQESREVYSDTNPQLCATCACIQASYTYSYSYSYTYFYTYSYAYSYSYSYTYAYSYSYTFVFARPSSNHSRQDQIRRQVSRVPA